MLAFAIRQEKQMEALTDWKTQLLLFIGNVFIDETQENQVKIMTKLEPSVGWLLTKYILKIQDFSQVVVITN